MSEEQKSPGQKAMDWIKANHEQQPSLGAEVKAMTREAIKDVRGTLHESFFGQTEHYGEQGTPLNPTPQIVTQDLQQSEGIESMLESYASRVQQQEQDKDQGMER